MPNDMFQDLLPLEAIRTAPGEYDVKDRRGQTLWHMEGAALADWICRRVNDYSVPEMEIYRDNLEILLYGDEKQEG